LIPNGKRIKKVQVGKNMLNYGSMLVLSHFKGHPILLSCSAFSNLFRMNACLVAVQLDCIVNLKIVCAAE